MDRRRAAGALLALAACIACSAAAPTLNEHTSLDLYDGTSAGCYYNFQHYGEGDRIMTNEPCLNCTCHNRMLMCYLRVCPFTKPIGQDCTVEKRADQCCPIVTCPDVPVDLLTSTSTTSPAEYGGTGVGKPDKYGCSINGRYFPEGSKVPPTPNKPCEHCYCIRNMTTCVMQECTLHVDGCTPIYHKDVCCPVRYSCDHLDDETLLLDDMTTTVRPTPGFLLTTTIPSPVTQMSQDCVHDDKIFADGALIKTEKACEHCYCMKGDIVCVVQECGTPMENEGKNCTSLPPREGQCCPDTYICEGDEIATESLELFTTEIVQDELTTLKPPRRYGVEGSGYRKEPDNTSYTATPSTETEIEGSGYEEKLETPQGSNEIISSTVIHEHVTTKIPVAEEIKPEKEITEEKLPKIPQQEHEKTTTISEKYEIPSTTEEVQKVTNENYELDQGITNGSTSTEFVTKSNKEEFIGETTQENVSLPEENISTITSELGSKAIVTTETVKHDLSTIVSIEENDISITTSSTIFEESEGVTTDKEHKIISGVLLEKERPQIGEYNPSTSSTPFLEEVEKVTTQTQEQHIVTDNISETEAFGPHKYASTITIPKIEVNKESDTISGDNTLPDTESHEYIPIATSAPIGDESEKGITSQVDMVTSDFTEEEINKSHKYTPSTINSILEDNEFITTETNRESSVSNEVPKISEAHSYISSTTIGLDITSEDHKLTTEVFEHDIVTDRTRKDDDTYHYTLTTTSMIPMAEESLVTVKEKDEKVIISASTEIDKTTTDKYIATTLSAPHLEEHKTTVREYGDEITEGDSKEGSISSEKDFSNTGELSFSKPVGEISTELNKYETSTTKLEDKESYESHKLHSTGTFGIEEDYITTTEYTGKGEEFISHEISESGTKASENIPDASSTPFLEEIEKATPEVSEHVISSIVGESDIHTPEKHLPSTDSISKLDEEVTTIIESDNMIDVTPPNNIVDNENFGLIVPEKTTQDETSKYETTVTSIRVTDEKQTDDIDSVTTDAHSYSTSSLNSFITKEDQLTATTEPSFRKEDNYVQSTLELSQDIITSIPNIESSTIIDPIGLPHENSSIPVYPEYIHESHKPVSLQETTVKIITETVTQNKDNLPVSVDEELIVTTTHALDKNDLFETSTINFEENEIHKDILTSVGRIPGEGDCLLNGVTYINESAVPSTNKCHSGCKCLSSIITCDPIICSPPPEYMDNCQPTYDSPESCCPTYVCDQVRETLPPLPYKHVTTPETPKQSIAIECHGDECEISKDKKQSTVSSELCAAGSCSTDFDHQDTSKCGPQGCTEDSQFSVQNVPSTEKSELCVNGKCEQPLVQVPEEELCKGDNCKSVSDTLLHGSQQDSKPQEVSSIPCIGESCTNIISEPHDTAVQCNEHNGCTVNQDTIGQECTDDSCRRKETMNVGHTPLCSGINCEHNQIPPGEPPKNIHHSTYEPIVEQSTETEATPILSLSPDIVTRPVEQHAADESSSGDKIPNFISEDKEVVTELPEIVTLSIHSTDIEKDSTSPPDMLITESQEPFTYEPQKPIGESHIIGSKQPIVDEQQSPTKQPSIIVPEDITHNIGYETSTGVSEDKLNKEEATGIIVDQPEDNIVKLQDQTKAPNLPISEIGKETILPETTISTSLDTNTRAPTIDELVTTILDTAKHEVSTAQSHEYTTSMPYRDEVELGTTISTHISVTYETSSDVSSITNSPDIMSLTENSIEVTASKKPLTSLNNQELTTAKFETDHVNDYTTLANDLELEQVNRNTDLPDQSENAHDEFEKNKSSTTGKPDAESYGTTSQKVSVTTQETTESLLTEKEYTDFVPSVTHKTVSEIPLTEADDSRTDSPLFNTIEEKLDTEAPLSHITESGDYAMEDDKTKTTLPTFETHEKRTETDSSSAVTEFEVHMPEIDVSRTTSPAITIEGGNVEVETTASLVTEPEKHVTVLPTFVTKEENIESGTSVAPVTEVELQKDKIDQVKEISQTFVTEEGKIQPETTSLLVTESASPVDERKTTLQQDEDNIVTGSPDSQITESVDYATHLDETKTTSPTTYFDKNENIQTDAPSIYMTEPAPHYTETEEIRTTLTTLIVKEETMKPEYSSSQVTEKGTFTSETYDKRTTLAEHITEQEKIYTQTPSSQFTKVEEATTELDETKTTSPTFTDEKVEAEFPVTVVTELNPHPDEVKETKTTIPTYSKEEEKNIIQTPSSQVIQEKDHSQVEDEAKTTLATFITTEKTIKEGVPTSFVTESEAYLSTLGETSVTLPTYITEVQKINEEPESEVSPVTVLGLHKDKENESNTVLPLLHVETESPVSYIPELESHTNDAAQTNTLPVTNVEDEKIESQFTSSYVTESGIYTTDIDKRKSTLSEIVPEKEKLDSEVPMSPVTESQSQANGIDKTGTITPSSIIQDDVTKTDSQSPHVTEPEVYVSEIYETKTTIPSSTTKEVNIEEMTPTTQATQTVSFEIETKIPTVVTETENIISEFAASTEKEIELQTNEIEETQTIQPIPFAEEGKTKLEAPLSQVTESGHHTGKLDETKTTLPVFVNENKNVATETSYSQVTEYIVHATVVDETRTTSSVPHLIEEGKFETELTTSDLPESEDHTSKVEEAKTTSPELSITEKDITGSESPASYVTEAEIYGTETVGTSSSLYTSLPEVEKHETEAPAYHTSISEVYATVINKTKTTTPAFITVEDNIKTEAPNVLGTESVGLITEMIPDRHKLSTLSEHLFTESEVHTTEISTIQVITVEDTDNINVEREQDNVKVTTELNVSGTFTHVKPDATSNPPLTENATEKEFVENVTTGEEDKLTTENSKVESMSSVGISEIGATQGYELATKVPEASLINEIYPGLQVTEGEKLSTDITEATSIGEGTDLSQDHYSKSPELLPVTTISAVAESEKLYTSSVVEDIQTLPTTDPQNSVNQHAVTTESEIDITASEVLETQKQIVTETEIMSTELPHTISSYTDIPAHPDLAQSTVPVVTQGQLTSSEPETPYIITLAPESLTTNLQEVSQTNLDEHHINEEEQTKIKPLVDSIDSSTIKSEMMTISQEQYFTEKQETIPIEYDSSTVSQEITTKKPDATEINVITTTQIQEDTTEHEQTKHTYVPVSENTETLPDVIELEEHTHKTLSEITTVSTIDDQSFIQTNPEKVDLEHQTPEKSTEKSSYEQHDIKESTAINEDTSTSFYEVEKSTVAAVSVEKTSEEIQGVNTTPVTTKQEESSTTSKQEETATSILTQVSEIENVSIPETSIPTEKPSKGDKSGTTTQIDEITVTTLKPTSPTIEKESQAPVAATPISETKPNDTSLSKVPKPVISATQPPDEISPPPEEEHFPSSGSSGYGGEPDYVEEDQAFGPGTCRYGGKVYVSAQQIPRDDPCDFCFCFRSDIICLQQSCPPPIHGCHEEPIQGFCCPRYECPVSMATTLNVTTTTTTTTTTLPPHFPTHSYKGAAHRRGCQIKGHTYKVGEVVRASSGPCLHCTCGGDGQMKCDPKACTPEPMLRQMIAAAVSAKRRR